MATWSGYVVKPQPTCVICKVVAPPTHGRIHQHATGQAWVCHACAGICVSQALARVFDPVRPSNSKG